MTSSSAPTEPAAANADEEDIPDGFGSKAHVRRKSYLPGDYETKLALDKYTQQDDGLDTLESAQQEQEDV